MKTFTTALENTLEVFHDLTNLYRYEEDTSGVLRKMYDDTLAVLHNTDIDVKELKDEKNNNILHLAADANNLSFFLLAARKGINPYLQNDKKRNAFQSRHYEFAHSLWKKFEHIYFDTTIEKKSFAHLTEGFHNLFKQAIYEENIQFNSSQYSLKEIINFLKTNDIYSHYNVLAFAYKKFDTPLLDLLEFVIAHEDSLTPEENSLALHCGLKLMVTSKNKIQSSYIFDMFINSATFAIDENFLQSMQLSASEYSQPLFQTVFNKQTEMLVNNSYNRKENFNFYYTCSHQKNGKKISSINNLTELYQVYSLEAVWNYYHIDHKLKIKTDSPIIKKPKI